MIYISLIDRELYRRYCLDVRKLGMVPMPLAMWKIIHGKTWGMRRKERLSYMRACTEAYLNGSLST